MAAVRFIVFSVMCSYMWIDAIRKWTHDSDMFDIALDMFGCACCILVMVMIILGVKV